MVQAHISGKAASKALNRGIEILSGEVLQYIDPCILRIDQRYQRSLSENKISKMKRNFNFKAIGILKVGQRRNSGHFFTYDGQHRLATIIRLIEEGVIPVDTKLLCAVTLDTTYEQEAKLFLEYNNTLKVGNNDLVKAGIVVGDEPAVTISNFIINEGFSISYAGGRPSAKNDTGNCIRGIGSLKRTFSKYSNQLQNAIALLRLVWGNGEASEVPLALRSGDCITALALFLYKNEELNFISSKSLETVAKAIIKSHWQFEECVKNTRGLGYKRFDLIADSLYQAIKKYL